MNESDYINGDEPIDVYALIGRESIVLMCEEYNAMFIKNIGYLAIKYSLEPDIVTFIICKVLGIIEPLNPVSIYLMSKV